MIVIVSKLKHFTLSFRSFSYFVSNISKTDAFILFYYSLYFQIYIATLYKYGKWKKNRLK